MSSEQANHSQGAFAAVRAKDSSSSAPVCAVPECSALAATVLRQQAWCVDHFLEQSYQALERLEQQRGTERDGRPLAVREQAGEEVRTFLNECSAKAGESRTQPAPGYSPVGRRTLRSPAPPRRTIWSRVGRSLPQQLRDLAFVGMAPQSASTYRNGRSSPLLQK